MEREQIFIDPFKGPSALLFIKAFTLWSIYPEIIFLTAWAAMLVLLDRFIPGLSLELPPTILTVLGTVIGFVLSYRTSSAYERYTEGRKQWSTVVHVSRTLACLIWSHCTYVLRIPTPTQPATDDEVNAERHHREKIFHQSHRRFCCQSQALSKRRAWHIL